MARASGTEQTFETYKKLKENGNKHTILNREAILKNIKGPLNITSVVRVDKIVELTKLKPEEITFLNKQMEERSKKLNFALNNLHSNKHKNHHSLPEHIANTFHTYYLQLKRVPSFPHLTEKSEFSNISIQDLIKNKNIVFEDIPKLKKYIIYEHPERMYERALYLTKILRFRSEKRNFTYFDLRLFKIDSFNCYLTLATPTRGILFKKWRIKENFLDDVVAVKNIVRSLVYEINFDTVVILYLYKDKDVIDEYTNRDKMIKWLQEKNIPFNKSAHSAELYKLIHMFNKKREEKKSLIQVILENHGFEVIQAPFGYPTLNYFSDFFDSIKSDYVETKMWFTYEEKLIENENDFKKRDLDMEHFMENLMKIIKNNEFTRGDLVQAGPSDSRDKTYAYISDFVID